MPVDPTDPDTFETEDQDEDVELGEETPEADAAEQHTEVRHRGDEPLTHVDPATVSEGDAAEQARAVDLDEDEDGYR
ncbi:hypothetical protein ACFRR7_01270 [Streptomyces sp. NPDC056909]|uniref:hypothetical protein n=1 Tax=unclassified Streptomyces TaxID=2593676 RepID=UPI00343A1F49|nr:hypothetical protein OG214_13530 [Streptomyces sp. NBC_00872]